MKQALVFVCFCEPSVIQADRHVVYCIRALVRIYHDFIGPEDGDFAQARRRGEADFFELKVES